MVGIYCHWNNHRSFDFAGTHSVSGSIRYTKCAKFTELLQCKILQTVCTGSSLQMAVYISTQCKPCLICPTLNL